MRLIDADALERHEADTYGAVEDVVYAEDIDNAPTIDAVEVVRCKDCTRCVRYRDEFVCGHALPTKNLEQYFQMGMSIMAIVKPDDFCAHGERRSHHDSLCDQTEEGEA